jgi:hypothetical protein
MTFSLRRFLGQLLAHYGLWVIGLADIERALPASFSEMEVPVRSSLGQLAVLLAPVGTLLELKDSITVVAALHDGAQWSIGQLLPPMVHGLL